MKQKPRYTKNIKNKTHKQIWHMYFDMYSIAMSLIKSMTFAFKIPSKLIHFYHHKKTQMRLRLIILINCTK